MLISAGQLDYCNVFVLITALVIWHPTRASSRFLKDIQHCYTKNPSDVFHFSLMFGTVIHLVNDIQVLIWNLCLNLENHMNEIKSSIILVGQCYQSFSFCLKNDKLYVTRWQVWTIEN